MRRAAKITAYPRTHKACEYLDAYRELAELAEQPSAPLSQGLRHGKRTDKPLTQSAASAMIQTSLSSGGALG